MIRNSESATRQELAAMFGMKLDAVVHITSMLNPTEDVPNRRARFNIREFAERAVAPMLDADVIAQLMRTKPEELPDKLRTAFWSAKLKQQEYDTKAKDLWPTTEIVEYCGDAFKVVRLSLQLLPDTLDRAVKMTDLHRQVIQDTIDTTLGDMRRKMIDAFKNRRKSAERGPSPRKKDSEDFDL
jgi:hypothetical protein